MTDRQEVIKRAFEQPQWYLASHAFNIKIRIETILEFTRNLKCESILDIGCGDGSLSLPLLTDSNCITFLDRSKSMLELVRSRIPSRWTDRTAFLNQDVMDARLPEESFDLIICVGVMAYIADRRTIIRKVASLLRPGGTLIIECSDGEHFYTRMNCAYEAFRVKLGRADFPTIARPASELTGLLEQSGLEQCDAFRYSLPPCALRRLLSQSASYNLVRLLFGAAGRNRTAWCGNECLFHFKRKVELGEATPRMSPFSEFVPLLASAASVSSWNPLLMNTLDWSGTGNTAVSHADLLAQPGNKMWKNRYYVVVSPVRNEGKYLPLTINSMVAQSIRPACWVIVNDGSKDDTGRIAEQAAESNPWIKVVNRPDRGFRKAGGGVVEAFYEGYRLIENQSWDYVVKLDGDLSFSPDYFEKCFIEFEQDEHLGVAGGTICRRVGEAIEPEAKADPIFHVRGATKIYRATCWHEIAGLIQAPGWDTLDEVKANMLGWATRTLSELNVIHHRPTGAAYGTWNDRVKSGLANYISGYHPLFMLLKCLRRMASQPYLVGGLGLLFGFVKGYLARIPQVEDRALISYLRQQQINRLIGRKSLWN